MKRDTISTQLCTLYNDLLDLPVVAGLLDGWQCKSIQIYQKFLSF